MTPPLKSNPTPSPTLLWFRNDLRLDDHDALHAAADRGVPIIPVYIHAPDEENLDARNQWAPGGASRWWLHHSLNALQSVLARHNSRLIIRAGETLATLRALIAETGAGAVYWSRRWEPAVIARDTRIKSALREQGIDARSFNAALLFEPTAIANGSGEPYRVFTPFWKACLKRADEVARPRECPTLAAPARWPDSEPLDALELLPKIDWAGGMRTAWIPGETGAAHALEQFLDAALPAYPADRDRPDITGTSRLSPHLHFGEISPRRIFHAARERAELDPRRGAGPAVEKFLAEIGWREFAHHLFYHFPKTPTQPLRPEFARFPWRRDARALRAWQRGLTGYPLVDAGMRELWATGWMHNRVRMIVASFLVKDLLISWQSGAAWFWDTLVDADLASNTLGWQWTSGCGADAAPYFRIFNPVTQGKKFDPKGDYVRRWVPELAALPDTFIHEPWTADPLALAAGGIELGRTYPLPIVDHAKARDRALEALQTIKKNVSGKMESENE